MAPVLRKTTMEQTKKVEKVVNRRLLLKKLEKDRQWNRENVLWFKFPDLIQREILSYLNPKSLMEFSKTAKDIKNDVFSYNTLLFALHLVETTQKSILKFFFGSKPKENPDYQLEFTRNRKRKGTRIICRKFEIRRPQVIARYGDDVEVWNYFGGIHIHKKVVWEEMETKKIDVVVSEHLRKYLKMYQNSIQQFSFENKITSINSFDLKCLKRLVDLQIRSKEELDLLKIGFIDIQQFMRLKKVLAVDTSLPFDKVITFKAEYADIKCEELDEERAIAYLKMWENEELPQSVDFRTIRNTKIDNLDLTACETHIERNKKNPYDMLYESLKSKSRNDSSKTTIVIHHKKTYS